MAAADDLHRSLERLVELGQTPDMDLRPVLLRVLVDVFAHKPHHSASSLQQFTEIMPYLLAEADEASLVVTAEKLCGHPEVPPAVVRIFVEGRGEPAALFLEHAEVEADLLAHAATWGTEVMARAVARRPDLDPYLANLLAERPERDVLLALLTNTAADIDRGTIQYLVRRARGEPDLASAMLARTGTVPADLAPLFLAASESQRAAILLAARRDDLGPDLQKAPLTEMQEKALAQLESMLMTASGMNCLEETLASALGRPTHDVRRLIEDAGGEPLAVALAAAGASPELAARIFILSSPSSGRPILTIRALVAMVSGLSTRTARRLLVAILGSEARPPRSVRIDSDAPRRRPEVARGGSARLDDAASRRRPAAGNGR